MSHSMVEQVVDYYTEKVSINNHIRRSWLLAKLVECNMEDHGTCPFKVEMTDPLYGIQCV